MKISIRKNKLAFILISSIGLLIASLGCFFLPEKFFFDSRIIIYDELNEIGLIGSYAFTIWFYKITGLKYLHFSIIGILQFVVVFYILRKIGIPSNFSKLTVKNILIYFSLLILAIFICMPTKEFINFIYISLIVFLFINRKFEFKRTIFFGLLLILFFGFFFRPYYFLIAILIVVMYLTSFINLKNKRLTNIFFGLITVIGLSLSYGAVKGVFISQKARDFVNVSRIGSENASSMITSPIDTDTWYGESFGIVYGFFTVNLPINGIKFFLKPQILAFVFWQLLLFIILYNRFGKCIKEGKKNNYDLWMFYFVFSYFIIQGVFEPDLGSAVRHKAGIFPLIYYLLNYETFRKKS